MILAGSAVTAVNSSQASASSSSRTSCSSEPSSTSGPRPVEYPGLSELLASDPDLLLLRKFSTLRVRKLLHLQHEIGVREEELAKLEKSTDMYHDSLRFPNGDSGAQIVAERDAIMQKLDPLLEKYGWPLSTYVMPDDWLTPFVEKAQLRYAKLEKLPSAEARQLRNLDVYLNENNPIVVEEAAIFDDKKDLISLAPHEKDAVYRLVQRNWENAMGKPIIRLISVFRPYYHYLAGSCSHISEIVHGVFGKGSSHQGPPKPPHDLEQQDSSAGSA